MSREDLHECVLETAEGMLFEEFEATSVPRPEGDFLWARITLASPLRGDLVVVATETVATELAATLFGEELHGASRETNLDLLAEFANTIAGTLARKTSEEQHLELSPPSRKVGEPPHGLEWLRFGAPNYEFFVGTHLEGT